MICPKCKGVGWLLDHPAGVPFSQSLAEMCLCDYEGCVNGVVHCCDGLTAQPEGDDLPPKGRP